MTRFWENGSGHAGDCPHIRKMLKILSVELSLEILVELAQRSQDVTSVADSLELDVAVISRSLKQLHSFSMVEVKREKQRHLYKLGTGVEVFLNGQSVCVRAKSADGGEVSLVLPRPRNGSKPSGQT